MATQLTTLISAIMQASLSTDLGVLSPRVSVEGIRLAHGTSVDQADLAFVQPGVVVDSSTPKAYDLAGGTLVDVANNPLSFAEVVGIAVMSQAENSADILRVGGGSNAFESWLSASGAALRIGKGGVILLFNPDDPAYAVTAGTGDILRISCEAGTNVPFLIAVVGRSV